ncbi:DUF3089 domain-containing protein [Sphingomonas hankyongi]|uniref:DUF3089 domain-containing protein n=1 Tax=Sphingomonas hankyongi TaxID=2908209 RepID=A0ABT0RZV0_9SPHN|nr:DUF3089 domain-containing protein [Sphingomonas hankyongi]MCL6729130.1 DUF3089 domain-containing protein [Sphingomonas hankyongi]
MRAFILAAAALAAAAPAGAQTRAAAAAPDYAKDSGWLCLPGRADICSTPLPTTALNSNGYGSVGRSTVANNPAIDCFYVYPTVSSDAGLNSDMNPGREEKLATESQFARFAGVCRPFAPVYRQMTLASVAAYAAGVDITQAAVLAYGDVVAAWRNYIATRNAGRPFVLIGHSQGSLMIQQLIAREIETKPDVARRMKLAIIPGYNVLVPQGRLVGGTFKKTPLCNGPSQTGCVITWTSFREKNAPPPGAIFGYADKPGMTVACVNPARPGSRNWESLDSYFFTRSTLPVPGGPVQWSTDGAPPTPYVRTEGLVSARCVNEGQRGYLSVRTNADPKDKRTDRIGGEVAVLGMFLPGWGMHLADMAIAEGDLMRQVGDRAGK